MSEKGSQRSHLGLDRRDMGRKRSRPVSGSSGGSGPRHEAQASGSCKRVAMENPAALKDRKERQRQERLAKSRATAAVSRERRRVEIGEMGARAEELEQNNSYLKGLLDTRDQEKQLLALEYDQLLQAQQSPVSFPENMAAPSSAAFGPMPDLAPVPELLTDHGGQPHGPNDMPPQMWRSAFTEPTPAAESMGVDAIDGGACLGGPAFGPAHLSAGALAPAARLSGSQRAELQLQPDSRGEPTADAVSGGSQGTGCSGPAQITGLRSSGHSAAALPLLDTSPKHPAPERRLLLESQRSLGVGPGLDMPAPSWPRASHTFSDQALRAQLMAPLGPSVDALGDGWEEDRLQRLASGSDCGQAMGRKESASLPLHLQPQLLQDFRRKGSASLPTFWGYPDARESLLSRSGSMPGLGVSGRPGVIVGLDGQWIRLKPGYGPFAAQDPGLSMPGQPAVHSQLTSLPIWVPNQPKQTFCPGRTAASGITEETEPLPQPAHETPDHLELQWGTPPTKYDSRESDDLCFGAGLESLGIPDQAGLALQQPSMGLDSDLPGNTQPIRTTICPPGDAPPITAPLSAAGAQLGISDVRSEEPDFLNDSPFPG